ncbi:MAG: hypothetical protein WD557_00810 [Dehalococcoidia bacterium]
MKTAVDERVRLANALGFLREATMHLSLPWEEQVAWLKEARVYPTVEELGLDFGAWYPMADQFVEAGLLSPPALAQLSEIGQLLDALAEGDEENWLPEALDSDPRWGKIREIARAVAPCL